MKKLRMLWKKFNINFFTAVSSTVVALIGVIILIMADKPFLGLGVLLGACILASIPLFTDINMDKTNNDRS